ncbi:MAG: protein kinase [Gemmatimonadetes bacterium]|nr:protein kinase [Gemmatimonadota bacterium]
MAAALTGRYTIEGELGAGGMATVYLANDLKHGRQVALKVMRTELAESLGRDRFLREIQLAARLAHPHILPLHDSGDAGGALFYVMPNVRGQSLRDRMNAGLMSVAEAVRITREIAGALDYAHRHDVVHRDIKPENIMLQDGHAMVADFGIGKAVSDLAGDTLTQAGVSVGTPAYMSPEQAVGEAVDGRSDLYSLACVLYEMLVGEPPFTGPNVQAVIAKRFVQTPADVTALREGVPRPVARALQKALSRTPIDRYDTGALFAAALGETEASVAPSKAPEKSLAVMPFASLSRDPDDEFFADGVTEEILNALSQIPGLHVAGRSSSFSFKGRNEDLRTIGAKLNVATILEGTLRRSGTRLRITVQLIDAADGYQLWSERYERVIEDVFAVQDESASTIAARLRVSLAAPGAAPRAPTRNLTAYELYLKGRTLLYQRGTSIAKAIDCFQQAVTLDPEYAQAWAGLADGFTTTAHGGFVTAGAVMPKALEAARRAMRLDPDLAEAHSALACASMMWERDYDLAGREFRRAMELNPNYAQGRAWYGLWYLHWVMGRTAEAREVITRLCEIDPLSGYAHAILGFLDLTSDRIAESVEELRRAIELDPASYLAHWAHSCALHAAGRLEEAAAAGERALAMSGRHGWSLGSLVLVYADWGRMDRTRELYAELIARGEQMYVQPGMTCAAAARVAGIEAGLATLARGVEDRDPSCLTLVRTWPTMAALRADPRFYETVRPLDLPNFAPPA